ncbi:hypothetical protein [Spirosoma utsteinense]|uniref:Lipocalin-like domain-containing protein n=1 Tax=Spirosoma utsteinense TaxID=2585773 RepID=A0ABR6WDH7_9BACT|nr:hypothetical protein [Spirosoma utsteinense]MBC3785679.1 hypothetical protein [Spirosoma utsteinense]MBC3794586.1 hypothetical protein [Spirosoma utsteinense]
MKSIVLVVLAGAFFIVAGCHQEVNPIKEHTQDVQQAKKWLLGRWKLVRVSVQLPNPTVPNVELLVDEHQIELLQDGSRTDQVGYEIISINNGLKITTNAQPRADNWYIRNPSLYINKKRMFFDLGVASDGPGFEFVKVS